MSLQDAKEEAQAVLDSAEMLMETVPGGGETRSELERKTTQLEQELQDPESEESLQKIIDEVRELMDDLEGSEPDDMMGPEAEDPMGPGGFEEPDDDIPPF